MAKAFLRADTFRLLRLGKNRKKLQKWRRPRGKHNKLRLKRTGHSSMPSIGCATPAVKSGKINGLTPKLIYNLKDLQNSTKENIIFLSKRLGAKKRMDLLKKATELGLKVANTGAKV